MFTQKNALKFAVLAVVTGALMLGLTSTIYAVEEPIGSKAATPAPKAAVVIPVQKDDDPDPPVQEDTSCDPNARMYNGLDVRNVQAGGVYTDSKPMRLHITCDTPVVAYMHNDSVLKIYLAKGMKMSETSVDVLNLASEGSITIPTEDGLGTITLKPFQWGILYVSVEHPTDNNGMAMHSKILWGHYEIPPG